VTRGPTGIGPIVAVLLAAGFGSAQTPADPGAESEATEGTAAASVRARAGGRAPRPSRFRRPPVEGAWATVASEDEPGRDPTKAEVPLPAAEGWQASLVIDNGSVGIWTVGTLKAFPLYGCAEIFGLDDEGHCHILSSYSGKWTPYHTVEDGAWLGALQMLDLDPRLPGEEIYTGGEKGNLFQIRPLRDGGFDVATIARFPGEEIHTLVGGDLLPSRPGRELLLYTRRGQVFDVRPREDEADFAAAAPGSLAPAFVATLYADVQSRVRQALPLPCASGEAPWIAAVCRSGEVALLRMTEEGLERRTVVREAMGFGRLALRPSKPGEPVVLYASRDDGVILRLEGDVHDRAWRREVIFVGPQGPRGVAAGRFDADPSVETVAVFGYSRRVQLLSRRPGGDWTARTIFEDRDKGHWLATGELDGRNATDELIGSGYGARIFLLSRDPGTGLEGAAMDDAPDERPVMGDG